MSKDMSIHVSQKTCTPARGPPTSVHIMPLEPHGTPFKDIFYLLFYNSLCLTNSKVKDLSGFVFKNGNDIHEFIRQRRCKFNVLIRGGKWCTQWCSVVRHGL